METTATPFNMNWCMIYQKYCPDCGRMGQCERMAQCPEEIRVYYSTHIDSQWGK